jgi:hypothetical protein
MNALITHTIRITNVTSKPIVMQFAQRGTLLCSVAVNGNEQLMLQMPPLIGRFRSTVRPRTRRVTKTFTKMYAARCYAPCCKGIRPAYAGLLDLEVR